MSVTNTAYSPGTNIIEKYQIYQIEVSVISWNLDGTCTVEISIDAEKTYESNKGYYIPDEIPITITDSNGKTTYEAISFHTKSLTLEVDASLNYDIIVKANNFYV